MGHPWGLFFGFYKTRHILVSDSAKFAVLRAVVLTQYRRVTDGRTDGQTDGIAIASTALTMRRAVKTRTVNLSHYFGSFTAVEVAVRLRSPGGSSCMTAIPYMRVNVIHGPKEPAIGIN